MKILGFIPRGQVRLGVRCLGVKCPGVRCPGVKCPGSGVQGSVVRGSGVTGGQVSMGVRCLWGSSVSGVRYHFAIGDPVSWRSSV